MVGRTSMKCAHSTLFAAPTHTDTFLYLPLSKVSWDNPAESVERRQTGLFATRLTNMQSHTCTHTHLFFFFITAGGAFEAVTNCPASWAHPRRASSVPLFDAGLVINSGKSVSSSLLMCTQHQHTHKNAQSTSIVIPALSLGTLRASPLRGGIEIVSRCARGNQRRFDRAEQHVAFSWC